ncbi:MAG: tRNA (guanosine(37)-N1)-methyltransferase TrmD [Desulfobacterales bacterium]|nr:tRNA (guanosine(37)-N1)-methyltransferase TrmD [Desulfobacterales bacterium]MDD4072341.1 tRNA (guanosine(37)-N1)-methyltransferase TrmD [Desulfobacterales bacterium]MDD4392391.1 tRNA (guanosine(37)-N1)-methyltransferase TrmD [Desulfobacterales bacterium]
MKIDVLTIFPEMFDAFREYGMIRKAVQEHKVFVSAVNIRDFADGRHRVTDDRPYGGGCGMVMKPGPLAGAIRSAKKQSPLSRTILLSPQGRVFDQNLAREFATWEGMILVCGRYEGVDERVCQDEIDYEISIGDYVLTGGELAAMVITEAVVRLIPGVLGGEESAEKDSFENDLLEHGHYTRPYDFEGKTVPEVLLSGNHKDIEQWRHETSLIRTFLKRPDLLRRRFLSVQEKEILKKWWRDIEDIIHA